MKLEIADEFHLPCASRCNFDRGFQNAQQEQSESDEESAGEAEEILEDIQEALEMAKSQAVLPPVRITRILAGEGSGQFTNPKNPVSKGATVPLSVAMDYVGGILDESSEEIARLQVSLSMIFTLINSMICLLCACETSNTDI